MWLLALATLVMMAAASPLCTSPLQSVADSPAVSAVGPGEGNMCTWGFDPVPYFYAGDFLSFTPFSVVTDLTVTEFQPYSNYIQGLNWMGEIVDMSATGGLFEGEIVFITTTTTGSLEVYFQFYFQQAGDCEYTLLTSVDMTQTGAVSTTCNDYSSSCPLADDHGQCTFITMQFSANIGATYVTNPGANMVMRTVISAIYSGDGIESNAAIAQISVNNGASMVDIDLLYSTPEGYACSIPLVVEPITDQSCSNSRSNSASESRTNPPPTETPSPSPPPEMAPDPTASPSPSPSVSLAPPPACIPLINTIDSNEEYVVGPSNTDGCAVESGPTSIVYANPSASSYTVSFNITNTGGHTLGINGVTINGNFVTGTSSAFEVLIRVISPLTVRASVSAALYRVTDCLVLLASGSNLELVENYEGPCTYYGNQTCPVSASVNCQNQLAAFGPYVLPDVFSDPSGTNYVLQITINNSPPNTTAFASLDALISLAPESFQTIPIISADSPPVCSAPLQIYMPDMDFSCSASESESPSVSVSSSTSQSYNCKATFDYVYLGTFFIKPVLNGMNNRNTCTMGPTLKPLLYGENNRPFSIIFGVDSLGGGEISMAGEFFGIAPGSNTTFILDLVTNAESAGDLSQFVITVDLLSVIACSFTSYKNYTLSVVPFTPSPTNADGHVCPLTVSSFAPNISYINFNPVYVDLTEMLDSPDGSHFAIQFSFSCPGCININPFFLGITGLQLQVDAGRSDINLFQGSDAYDCSAYIAPDIPFFATTCSRSDSPSESASPSQSQIQPVILEDRIITNFGSAYDCASPFETLFYAYNVTASVEQYYEHLADTVNTDQMVTDRWVVAPQGTLNCSSFDLLYNNFGAISPLSAILLDVDNYNNGSREVLGVVTSAPTFDYSITYIQSLDRLFSSCAESVDSPVCSILLKLDESLPNIYYFDQPILNLRKR